jgi:hypothetical protein
MAKIEFHEDPARIMILSDDGRIVGAVFPSEGDSVEDVEGRVAGLVAAADAPPVTIPAGMNAGRVKDMFAQIEKRHGSNGKGKGDSRGWGGVVEAVTTEPEADVEVKAKKVRNPKAATK